MLLVSLPLCFYVLYHTRESNYEVEKVIHVEDVGENQLHVALPKGHHLDMGQGDIAAIEEKKATEGGEIISPV